MLKLTLAFLLVALWGTGSALAHDYRCYHGLAIVSCAEIPYYAGPFTAYWVAAPLPYAEPHDPRGQIILEGAAGTGAPQGD
jgi:hypothetical protein